MRVIAGKYKGQKLFSATGHIRPTTDRIKEHIFSVLQQFIEGKTVIDLFSGSGNLGIECLSRGADYVTFVEKSFQSIQVLKRNLVRINIDDQYTIVQSDVLAFLKQNVEPVHFIFADPPFKWDRLNELIDLVFRENNLLPDGVFILESEKSHHVQWESDRFEIIQQKKFDRSIISFMGWKNES